ncbi:hypothetical protein GY45DRAFT_91589 [Cubamyces sp. BRFM 1775]|nr:hypothetical protein GY45DRAFT_91589 [Cubamyces sp. BRFM 1775]
MYGNLTYNATDYLLMDVDDLELGTMSLYCGVKAAEFDPEIATEHTRQLAAMLEDDIHLAPLFSSRIFPPLHNLCRFWPIRAVERLTLKLENETSKTLATAPLVIQYPESPFTPHVPTQNVVARMQGARDVVQRKLGSTFRPGSCVGDIVVGYLLDAKLPDHSGCYEDELPVAARRRP